ncbi:MAG: YqaJ viral recombinase family protein [bacterium]|nr:YqaJ viral recombinase family protein [bacterium]
MPISEHQRQQRRSCLGSSDMPMVMGVSHWGGAGDVYLSKVSDTDERKPTPWMLEGNMLEGALLNWAEVELGESITRNQTRTVPDTPIRCNIDAIVRRSYRPIEAKCVDRWSPQFDLWGEPGTDEVPDDVNIQCHCHLMACRAQRPGVSVCYVPCLLGGRFMMYRITYNHELAAKIVKAASVFWAHVESRFKRDDWGIPSLQLMKRLVRSPDSVVDVDPELVLEYMRVKKVESDAKAQAKLAERVLLDALGDSEAGGGAEALFYTYYEQKRKQVTIPESKFRVLRIPKEGKKWLLTWDENRKAGLHYEERNSNQARPYCEAVGTLRPLREPECGGGGGGASPDPGETGQGSGKLGGLPLPEVPGPGAQDGKATEAVREEGGD